MARTIQLPSGEDITDRRSAMTGYTRMTWWLMVSAVGLVSTGAILWMTNVNATMTQLHESDKRRGEQIAGLIESEVQNKRYQTNMVDWMIRIEVKLDRILETRR